MTFNISNDQPQPTYTSWADIQGAQEEKVEETLTPEEIKAIIAGLDKEIDDLLQAAADMLKNGGSMDSPEFQKKYDEIVAKYQERADKQTALNEATGGTDGDTNAYPPSIMSEILNKIGDPDLVAKLKEDMKDKIDELNRAWSKIRDAIVSAIVASMSGGSGGSGGGNSNSDADTKNNASLGPINLYTEIKTKETDKTKDGDVSGTTGTDTNTENNVEGTEKPAETTDPQTTSGTDSSTTT